MCRVQLMIYSFTYGSLSLQCTRCSECEIWNELHSDQQKFLCLFTAPFPCVLSAFNHGYGVRTRSPSK